MTKPIVNPNELNLYAFLTEKLGITPAGAYGVLGNFQVESGFDPTSSNAKEGAIGIAQWELGRRTALDAYASKHGLKETDLTAQEGYLQQELQGPFSGVLSYLKKASDPGAAAAYVDQNFERSAGTTRTARVNDAVAISKSGIVGGSVASGGILGTIGQIGEAGGSITQGAIDAIDTPFKILKALYEDVTSVDWWIRIGFILIGFLILLIAIDKLSDGGLTGSSGGSAPETVDVVVDKTGDAGTAVQGAAKATGDKVKDTAQKASPGSAKDKASSPAKTAAKAATV